MKDEVIKKEQARTLSESANQVAHKGRKGANGRTSDFIARFMYNLQNKDFVPPFVNKNNSNVPLPSTLMYIENKCFLSKNTNKLFCCLKLRVCE